MLATQININYPIARNIVKASIKIMLVFVAVFVTHTNTRTYNKQLISTVQVEDISK